MSDEDAYENLCRAGIERLRQQQSDAVMPLIGPLLDAWDGMPNDEKDPDSSLYRVMGQIARAMEGP